MSNGYSVSVDNKEVDPSTRPEYTKMKKITVAWRENNV